jgi:hypothetical protein
MPRLVAHKPLTESYRDIAGRRYDCPDHLHPRSTKPLPAGSVQIWQYQLSATLEQWHPGMMNDNDRQHSQTAA